MTVEKTSYKGTEALAMEYGAYRAVLLPGQGAKLCSLKEQPDGREYVYQGKTKSYRFSTYGKGYLDGECAGIDEMFPNIDEYYYDAEPWKGIWFPDHGEVWALPWKYEMEEDALWFRTYGVRLPYCLIKYVSWEEEGVLLINYTLENLSSFSMDYIWAAHMMLSGEPGCSFEFPKGMDKAYTTMSDSGLIGRYGDTFTYPLLHCPDGREYDIRLHRGREADDYQKFYFAEPVPGEIGWGRICYPDHRRLTIEFPAREVPYLGAVQAEGGVLNLRCMFLEPCTGAFDRPDLAKLHGMNSVLKPYETKKWYLRIRISNWNGGKYERTAKEVSERN